MAKWHKASQDHVIIGWGNGSSHVQCKTITWTNADLLSNGSQEQTSIYFPVDSPSQTVSKEKAFSLLTVCDGESTGKLYVSVIYYMCVVCHDVIMTHHTHIIHYTDVIMGVMASQITSLTICLLNRLFGHRSKKTSKLRVTGLCVGNSPGTGEFPAQMSSNAENISIWWRHHDVVIYSQVPL